MKIIVTGFEPFLNNDVNSTKEIIKLLPSTIEGNKVITVLLPVLFDKSFELLKEIITKEKPDVIINLGLAADRDAITPERVAINVSHTNYPDNAGVSPKHKPISTNGENAYFTKLNLEKIIEKLQNSNIPVRISNSAGTYVCNNLMYLVLEYIEQQNLSIIAGFVHIPQMDQISIDKEKFSLPLDTMLEAVIEIIKTCIY